MMTLSARLLIRRWYAQIEAQPPRVDWNLRHLAAHTIIPDSDQSVFCESDFTSLPRVLDLMLTSEINESGDVVGITVKAYRSSYDQTTNTFKIGGPENFKSVKDLKLRPFRGARGRVMNPAREAGAMLAAYEMNAEREAAWRRPNLQRLPKFAEAVLSFTKDNTPEYEASVGLKQLAWATVQHNAPPARSMCAPVGYFGKVRRVIRSMDHGISVIELEDRSEFDSRPESLCFEVPTWGRVLVKPGQLVSSGTPLAALTLPKKVLDPIRKSGRSIEEVWDGLEAYIGPSDARSLLRTIWDGEVFKWGNFTMAPHYILSTTQVSKACGVWRDLRGSLNRVCHSYRDPFQILRSGRREGKISVWSLNGPASYENLSFELLGGPVDLYSLPAGIEIHSPSLNEVMDVIEPEDD